jgi:cytochrome bd-type quinol oxidase subunit 2
MRLGRAKDLLARERQRIHPPPVSHASPVPSARPEAHMAQAVLAITGVALAVCLCMAALGVTARLDQMIATLVSQARPADGFRDVSLPWLWAGAAVGALLVSSVLLHTPGWWRRWVFWLASLSITLAWAPVLAFSSLRPTLAIPCLAVLVAGAVSFFYIARHHMPTDPSSPPDETR